MDERLFITAAEVADTLGISKAFAYKLVRQMNKELAEKGYLTIAGRVNREYFMEKLYDGKEQAAR